MSGRARWAGPALAPLLLLAVPSAAPDAADARRSPVLPPADADRAARQEALAGVWQGELPIGPRHLTIVVRLEREGGGWSATMDSPDQGTTGIPVDSVVVDSSVVRLHVGEIGGRYEGRVGVGRDGTVIRGLWRQRGRSIPLVLRPVEEADTPSRPQEPSGDVPYRTDSVRLVPPGSGVELSGTLAVPEGEGPFPAVLFVSGSGAQPRDGEVAGHRPFLVMADRLARRGVASLRLDDRGTGGSAGDHDATPLSRSAADVLAGARWLAEREAVAPGRVGLVAHSEGGLVASLAAARSPAALGFVVLLAPPAVPADSLMPAQNRAIGEAAGLSEAVVREQNRVTRRIFSILREEPDAGAALEAIRRAVKEGVAELPDRHRREFRQLMGRSRAARRAYTRMTTTRFRSYLALDPDTVHARLETPVLALYGSLDLQVPPRQSLPALAAQLARAPTDDVTIRVLPGLNHLLQPARSGLPGEYGRIEETTAPEVLRAVSGWIAAR
jgi:pimeloyl-ACP methyl ester carboxylesterase